jgi:hypothetical protein
MSTASAQRPRRARRVAGLAAVALCAVATAAAPAPALAHPVAKPAKSRAGSTVSCASTASSCRSCTRARTARSPRIRRRCPRPAAAWTSSSSATRQSRAHAGKWSSTAHTVCIFKTAKGEPACEGHAAVGGNQMLFFRTLPGGAPVVSGGTGAYLNATGSMASTEIGSTNNSDVVITIHLGK